MRMLPLWFLLVVLGVGILIVDSQKWKINSLGFHRYTDCIDYLMDQNSTTFEAALPVFRELHYVKVFYVEP